MMDEKKVVEAIDFFYGFENHYMDFGLDNLKSFMAKLGNPQNKTKVIHIAGTNGKGSVSSYLVSILMQAGYKTGCYNSPVVFEKRENITVNGKPITEEEFAGEVLLMKSCMEEAEKEKRLPTVFELETALAYSFFAHNDCDFAVVECGLGGMNDATNVTEHTILSVLTAISMDHMAYLGGTLQEIAGAKAGIIKEKVPVVTIEQKPLAQAVLEEAAEQKESELFVVSKNDIEIGKEEIGSQLFFYGKKAYEISMTGKYQAENAALAITAARILRTQGYDVTEEQIVRGVSSMFLPGRFEKIEEKPLVILDGAHNKEAAERLRENISDTLDGYYRIFIMGVFRDKDYKSIIDRKSVV